MGAPRRYDYDVFLSFRGSDTRKGFTDCLYQCLIDRGLRVFRDEYNLAMGREIGPDLLDAIRKSHIFIPILSKNFAGSKWCLEELSTMMDCIKKSTQVVLPIFYDVTPNEVRHQTGSYGKAFEEHTKNHEANIVQRWREALYWVGSLKGYELDKEANGYQGKFIKMIEARVLRELKTAELSVVNYLVGIQNHVESLMRMLILEEHDVRVVGICGMGGIGKTTLAKFMYNHLLDGFEGHCFLQDVRETSTRHGLQRLQSSLVAGLLDCKDPNYATIDEGLHELKRRFRNKKVLVILDDVFSVDQLSALAAADWFGPGSRIIITTRNKDILRAGSPPEHQVYEVTELNKNDALQLFCWNAFGKGTPPIEFRQLAKDIVEKTGGLPLALEVIGSSLFKKRRDIWKATLQKLKVEPDAEILRKLRISYDALDSGQKQMFLDIACLYCLEDKSKAAYLWRDQHKFDIECNIEKLQLYSLIKIDDDNRLRMHEQLQDLGRWIVHEENNREPGKRSRLWGSEAVDVLLKSRGSENIESIQLDQIGLEDCCLEPHHFQNLSNLRSLWLGCANLAGNFENVLQELKWLQWKVPSNCKATNLNLRELLVLDLSDSRVTHDWKDWKSIQEMSVKLKVLDLSSSKELTRIPDLSAFRNLERLNASNCERLQVIDPSIGKLKHLISLNMKGCRCIEELPERFNCKRTLVELVLDNTRIRKLPALENFKKLQILSAEKCECLEEIPSSIGKLTSLTDLRLDETSITELPESIGLLLSLTQLTLADTPLKELPESIGGLKSLVKLILTRTNTASLPDSIANLTLLQELKIDQSAVQCLPSALGKLKNLEVINASGCQFLGEVQVDLGLLSHLKVLLLRNTNITSIPGTIKNLPCLDTLDFACCRQLPTLPKLPSSLRCLSVTCLSSEHIPNLPDLINLKKLEFVNSEVPENLLLLPKLEKLHIFSSNLSHLLNGLSTLTTVKELSIDDVNLQFPLKFPNGLRKLSVSNCHLLERLKGLSNLQNLDELKLQGCHYLVEIECLGELKSLRSLYNSLCGKLCKLDGLENLETLDTVDVSECTNLERLPDLSKSSALFALRARRCAKLVEIHGISGLHSLKDLQICEAPIETLGDLSDLQSLETLNVSGCRKLKALDGLDELENLFHLDISGCKGIRRLPDLSNLSSLQHIYAHGCNELQGLEGLDKLVRVTVIDISRCSSIEKLPDLSRLRLLEYFNADGCEKLQEVQGLNHPGLKKSLTRNIKLQNEEKPIKQNTGKRCSCKSLCNRFSQSLLDEESLKY